jgi:ATP-dependent Lon protease
MKQKNNLQRARPYTPLPAKKLRCQYKPSSLGIRTTNDVEPSRDIIGQERALRAMKVGLEMTHFGYNIFITGLTGTGRTTTIKRLLRDFEQQTPSLRDHCYVYNFRNPDTPIALTLPAGQGKRLAHDMDAFIHEMRTTIPSVYESRRYQQAKKTIIQHFQDRQKSVLQDFEKRVKSQGFDLVQVQVGNLMRPDIVPVINNNPTPLDQVEQMIEKGELSQEQFDAMRASLNELEKQMGAVFRELRNIERKVQQSLLQLDEEILMPVVDDAINSLKAMYAIPKVQTYFDDVRQSIKNHPDRFRDSQTVQIGIEKEEKEEVKEDTFFEYQVNVFVDNSEQKHVPIIIETNPKYKNIFGAIEREFEKGGVWRTDFMHIKAGSLLRADGGYIVLNSLDTLMEPGVWQELKRTLRTGMVDIQTYEPVFGVSVTALKPEPIEINVKVIMIGDAFLYHFLYSRDEDFKKIFKIRADFDFEMSRTKTSAQQYTRFVKMICDDEKLLPFDAASVAQIIEYGSRLANDQKKLSTQFNIIADVVREANYWADKENSSIVNASHVERALDERTYRVKLVEEKVQDMILEGDILIHTKGWVVGQVNGLSVYNTGEYSFGKPTRITARTALGRNGIINIEREAELSGPTHNKGVAILAGFFRSLFAQNKPLVMDASLTFEQSYGGVDGDSASSTELYALLSSLAEIPIRQDIAVTGSVNQKGEIQAIGGVNEKIEGFYEVCKARGLTGTQGVIIPYQNIKNLMVREEIFEAVEKKKFHVYAIQTIDEGIEILTGVKAGKRRKNFTFEPDTVYARVDNKLTAYAKAWKQFESKIEVR